MNCLSSCSSLVPFKSRILYVDLKIFAKTVAWAKNIFGYLFRPMLTVLIYFWSNVGITGKINSILYYFYCKHAIILLKYRARITYWHHFFLVVNCKSLWSDSRTSNSLRIKYKYNSFETTTCSSKSYPNGRDEWQSYSWPRGRFVVHASTLLLSHPRFFSETFVFYPF